MAANALKGALVHQKGRSVVAKDLQAHQQPGRPSKAGSEGLRESHTALKAAPLHQKRPSAAARNLQAGKKNRHTPQNRARKPLGGHQRPKSGPSTPETPFGGRQKPPTAPKERQFLQKPAKQLLGGVKRPKKAACPPEMPHTPGSRTPIPHNAARGGFYTLPQTRNMDCPPPRRGHTPSLLLSGDMEPNPGPFPAQSCLLCPAPGTHPVPQGPTEDYQLHPHFFLEAPGRLGTATPTLDAFAAPWNSQLPNFWCHHVDAFRQSWLGSTPLWANPPFSLLHLVLRHLQDRGGTSY
jgi:hypothetical protein